MRKNDYLNMTWAELFAAISQAMDSRQPNHVVKMLQDVLQSILEHQLPTLKLEASISSASDAKSEYWIVDMVVMLSAQDPLVRTMAPFDICQAELFYIPGLFLLRDSGTVWEVAFRCDGGWRQWMDRPVCEWAEDVAARGMQGSIRARYLDPLNSLCSQLEKLPAWRREKFLACCTHIAMRYEPLAADIFQRNLPKAFEVRSALSQFEAQLEALGEKDFVVPRGVDPQEIRSASRAWFREAIKPWMGSYDDFAIDQENIETLFDGLWAGLTNGSRGPDYYTGTPRRFYIASVYFDESGTYVMREFPLIGTRQVLGLMFQSLPAWTPRDTTEHHISSRADTLAQLNAGAAWAAGAQFPMQRRSCLVMDWRDGSGVQYLDLSDWSEV